MASAIELNYVDPDNYDGLYPPKSVLVVGADPAGGGGDPVPVTWADVTGKPAVIAAGADAAAARTAIGAGTGNGTSNLTAAQAVAAVAAKAQIAALAPIADPATATAEDVATAVNAIIAALKA